MSEDVPELPEEPKEAGHDTHDSQEPGLDAVSPASQEAPAVPPVSESILPEQPVYPPRPEYYAQMPGRDPYGVPPSGFPPPAQGRPGFPPPAGLPGMPPFPPPSGYVPAGYRFDPVPPVQPLPLGQAIRELPRQYKKILFRPGVRSFLEEQGKAEWGIIWVQVLLQVFVGILLSVPRIVSLSQSTAGSSFSAEILSLEDVVLLVLGPAFFFGGVGIQYLLARAFKGTGSFKQQAYNQLLFGVPLGVISSVVSAVFLSLVDGTGGLFLHLMPTSSMTGQGYTTPPPVFNAGFLIGLLVFYLVVLALGVYQIILNVFALMATHRMSGGRATACVLIPPAVLYVLLFIVIFAAVFIVIAAAMPATQP
jgi:hypothetical protein